MPRILVCLVALALMPAPAAAATHGPIPSRPPALACSPEGCIFGEDGQMVDGFKYSASAAPLPGSVGWWEHTTYQPPGTRVRVRACVGAIPFPTGQCGPAAEMVTPWPRTVEEVIRSHFPGAVGDQAMRVARCESGLDPRAVSPTDDHGLFQLHATAHRARFPAVTGQSWSEVYDAETNTTYARWLYDQSGWTPWACKRVA